MAPVVIFTYHSISSGPPPLCISPRRLEDDLDFLAATGLQPMSLADIVRQLETGTVGEQPCYALTFDDGYRDFLTSAVPVLERRDVPSTLFVTTRGLRDAAHPELLSSDQLKAIAGSGVELGGHSTRHDDLRTLPSEALEADLLECRSRLDELAGRTVESFAYPFGHFDDRVRAAVARHFRSACTTRMATVEADTRLWELPRVDAYYLGRAALRKALASGRPQPYLALRRMIRAVRGIP